MSPLELFLVPLTAAAQDAIRIITKVAYIARFPAIFHEAPKLVNVKRFTDAMFENFLIVNNDMACEIH